MAGGQCREREAGLVEDRWGSSSGTCVGPRGGLLDGPRRE